jgi:glycosyltransferase involved in cell wall biosynthesis
MNSDPLVSIILVTYNRPYFLNKAIKSVLNQKYTNLELIVVNNGDDVKFIIDSFDDKRIRYFKNETNIGLGLARNVGLDNMTGNLFCMLDDDDRQENPYHLRLLVDFLKENNYHCVYSDAVCEVMRKDANGDYQIIQRVVPYSINYENDIILYENITPCNCLLYELDDMTKKIRFTDDRCYEDWKYTLEFTKYYPMYHLPLPTCVYTFRDDGTTMSSSRTEFTTMLPDIYKETYKRAKNQPQVCTNMNAILKTRGLPELFRIAQQ